MKKICVIGHFGFGENMLNGQTVKTKNVTTELEREFGVDQIVKIDTHGGLKALPRIIVEMMNAFRQCENILIFPAHNGIRVFVPLCVGMNFFPHRKLHYVVIGGWLNELLNEHRKIERDLKKFTGIYVETEAMKKTLKNRGFENVEVMHNFKNIQVLEEEELLYSESEPLRLCTFSRVMREKGIGEAIEAVKAINQKHGREVYSLDIYGQVDGEQKEWFEKIKQKFPEFIKYKGVVPFEQSVDALKEYYALLFPTYYDGEGFAGTLLDAMAAGIPAIVSDWKYNKEIVVPQKTGILVEAKNQNALNKILEEGMDLSWNNMKIFCIAEARKYMPEKAIQVLINNLA